LLYRAIRPLLGLGFAALVASLGAPGPLTVVGIAMLAAAVFLLAVERWPTRPAPEAKFDPLLRDGPLLAPDAETNSQDVRTVDEFAGYARAEGMAEFGEALAQERLRAQPDVERDVS
jgi:hypothetical protein